MVTVNAVSKLEEYHLPRVEDLFTALSGGKVFFKLDLSHAYQQIVLEEDYKNVLSLTLRRVYFSSNDFLLVSLPPLPFFNEQLRVCCKGYQGWLHILITF